MAALPESTTWHAGRHVIESVTNESQLPAVTSIRVQASCHRWW